MRTNVTVSSIAAFAIAGVDRNLNDLEDRAVGGRLIVALVAGDEMGSGDLHVVENDGSRERRPLAKR